MKCMDFIDTSLYSTAPDSRGMCQYGLRGDLYRINAKLISVLEDSLEFERQLPYSTVCFMQNRADVVYVVCVGFDTVIPTSFITLVHYILH